MTSSPPESQLDATPREGGDRLPRQGGRAGVPADRPGRTSPALVVVAGLLGLTGAVLTALVVGRPGAAGSGPLTVVWWLLGPGAALAVWWRRRVDLLFAVVAAGGSLAVLLLLAQTMLSAGAWDPRVGAGITGALAALSLLVRAGVAWSLRADTSAPLGLEVARRRPAARTAGRRGAAELRDVRRVLPVAALVVAVVLWLVLVPGQDPARMGPTGLLSTLSPLVWLAYVLLVAAAVGELVGARRPLVLGAVTLALVVGVFGVQSYALADGRNPVGWLHWGFASQIATDGHGLTNYDSRYSWPGFFAAAGVLRTIAAVGDPTEILRWTPLWFGAVGSAGAVAVTRAFFGPGPRAWIATWVFVAGNWVGQEYFSPQGATWAVAMAVLGVVCTCAAATGEPLSVRRRRPTGPDRISPLRAAAWTAEPGARSWAATVAVVLGAFALAPSHQLTPLFLALLLVPLALTRRVPRWAPVFVLAVVLLWWATGARSFWMNYWASMFGAVGDVSASLTENVGDRFSGSQARQLIIFTRLVSVAALGLVAVIGILRWRRTGGAWLTLTVWALLPFGMAALQPYGGEMLMRSLFFALPGLAIGAAAALPRCAAFGEAVPSRRGAHTAARGRSRLRVPAVALTAAGLGCLLLSTVVIKGQNDSYYGFTDSDLAATRAAYAQTSPGDFLATVAASSPARSQRIGVVRQRSLQGPCPLRTIDVACIEELSPDVVLATRSQAAFGTVTLGLPADWLSTLTAGLVATGDYRSVYDDGAGGQVLVATGS
ncbi:hypothetical protein [Kineococcus aurantiacus]|uniref:Uncharacterized protein n=1 Tax=Kineococcus aurantiacus TaxID=37633 RepID=A0A7Y9AS46_9ACTN|nr:hypothetical protein [Kineococcus aurantiacus]NYD20734.1 hypothetical protein [Kineococcus aurantiacus]